MSVLNQLGDIAKAYSYLLLDKFELTSEEKSNLSSKRLDVCNNCPLYKIETSICKKCGCYMPAKTFLKDIECPNKYW